MPPVSELMTLKQAAEFLGVDVHTVTKYHRHGVDGKRLRAIKRVRRVFFERADVEAFLVVTGGNEQQVEVQS